MNMDLDACPLPCCSSPGTPQRHVIHAQFQALWNPNSFTKGRSRPQSRAIMSSFDLSQGPKVSGSLYHLQLQDLNSTATTRLRLWEAFHSCQVMALEQQTSMGLPPHRKGVLPPGRWPSSPAVLPGDSHAPWRTEAMTPSPSQISLRPQGNPQLAGWGPGTSCGHGPDYNSLASVSFPVPTS